MLTYEVILHCSEMKQYEAVWAEILEEEQNNNPFIEFEWVYHWWDILGSEENVEIYVVKKEGNPIAFFPFVRREKWGVHVFSFVCNRNANYMGIVCRQQTIKVAIEFLFKQLEETYKSVVFHFKGLLESGASSTFIENYFIENQKSYHFYRTVCPYIQLKNMDLENYVYKRRKLHGMDRREKRLKQFGAITYKRANQDDYEQMYELFKNRWAKKVDTSNFTTHQNKLFVERLFPLHRNNFSVQVDAILFEEKWIGFKFGLTSRNRYVSYALGHDPNFDVFGPGRLLDREKIISAYNEQFDVYDFSIGFESYKFDWYTHNDFTREYIANSNTFFAMLLAKIYHSKENIKIFLKKHQWIVRFKRNSIGILLYAVKNKDLKELKTLINKVVAFKQFAIYKTEEILPRKYMFESVPMEKLLHNNSNIISEYYKGYTAYKPAAMASNTDISFLLHSKNLRIDAINYLEALPKSSCFLKQVHLDEIKNILSYLNKQKNYKEIFLVSRFFQFKKKRILKKHRMKKIKKIYYIKLFKWVWKKEVLLKH